MSELALEVSSRGAFAFDDRDMEQFTAPRVIRRPFVVDTARSKADAALLAMLLGND